MMRSVSRARVSLASEDGMPHSLFSFGAALNTARRAIEDSAFASAGRLD
jgi:hypothetical protein